MNGSETIQEMFSQIARDYDRGNAVLSFGLHRLWNRALVRAACSGKGTDALLDLCAGTGEIALGCLKEKRWDAAYLLDFCPQMLEIARDKGNELGVGLTLLQADAHDIPLPDASVDVVTTAYGIRNVTNPLRCGEEVFRVLRPGGRWLILELTRPRLKALRLFHGLYLRTLLPWMGHLVASNRKAYAYLASSISQFTAPEKLLPLLQGAGFSRVKAKELWGGIATIMTLQRE